MLYDCFTFYNELDVLEIRLNYLNDLVDKFVIVEMDKTFSGIEKPFVFEENKNRYKKFLNKITYIKVKCNANETNLSDYEKCWYRENYQRDCIMQGLNNAKDDDIIIISDADEIPSKIAIQCYSSGITALGQMMMYYYLNNLNIIDPMWTRGSKICHFSDLINPQVEIPLQFGMKYTKKGLPTYIRFCNKNLVTSGG